MENGQTIYHFIVDTEQYAGNFERSMVAYMTGLYGDCGVGEDESKIFAKEELQNDQYSDDLYGELIIQKPDDHGCYRPAYMCGGKNMSVGFSTYDRPYQVDIDLFVRRAKAFTEYMKNHPKDFMRDGITIIGFRLIEEKTVTTQETIWTENY